MNHEHEAPRTRSLDRGGLLSVVGGASLVAMVGDGAALVLGVPLVLGGSALVAAGIRQAGHR